MAGIKLILASVCLLVVVQEIAGHGYLWEPVGRNAAFKRGHGTPPNYNLNENFCGGAFVQASNGGKCGLCGDNYRDKQPRVHENGGKYGTGKIVAEYKQGQKTTIEVTLTANHMGHFEFAVCPLNGPNDIETEECFKKYPVRLADGRYKYPVKRGMRNFKIDVILPAGLTCKHCSFRWHYRGGNNWGICDPKTGRGAVGCGPQEHFRNCADISIL